MASFSGLGIGLGSVLGCIILALFAELYYLLWLKKKINNASREELEDHHHHHYFNTITNYAKKLSHLFSRKKPKSDSNKTQQVIITNSVPNQDAINGHEPDLELGSAEAPKNRGFDGQEEEEDDEESVESELRRLHSLCGGPPRFLFTIKEETKEDLESDDGRSRKRSRTRSLSDILVAVEAPMEFNPLFESLTEAEIDRMRSSSPPPKFKFLRDAEEKLMRRLIEEAEKLTTEERESGSFIRIVVGKNNNKEREAHHHHQQQQLLPQCHSTAASQVLPLDSNQPIQQ